MSAPEKPVRGIYFATHLHNFYHEAPPEEIARYVEDLALWGLNTLSVWYDMHHFNGFDDPIETLERNHRFRWWPGKLEGVKLILDWFPSRGARPQADPGAEESRGFETKCARQEPRG